MSFDLLSPLTSLRATELAYGGVKSFQKDKNAGRTKLDYRYWLVARTLEFRAEFGPWEQLRAEHRVDATAPTDIHYPNRWRGLSLETIREEMIKGLSKLKGNEREGKAPVPILHPELGAILVGKGGIGKTKAHSADPSKILVASQIQSLIPRAIYSHSEVLHKEKRNSQIVGYSTLLAKVHIEKSPMVAVFTIERKTDGVWYYNTVVLHETKEKTREFQIDGLTRTALVQVASLAGLEQSKGEVFERVNPDFVSKELDAATGEPTAAAIRRFIDFSMGIGSPSEKESFQALSLESKKLIEAARNAREAYRAQTRKEGRERVRECASEAARAIAGPEEAIISLKAAFMAFVTEKGGEQPLREFALAYGRARTPSNTLPHDRSKDSATTQP